MLGVGVGQVQVEERMVHCQVHCSTCVRLCLSPAGTSWWSEQYTCTCWVMVRAALQGGAAALALRCVCSWAVGLACV
jgi:hypothetical protein